MAKLESTFKNMFLSLLIISLTVGLLLSQVHKITAEPIAAAKALKLENAIKEVVPDFDNNPVSEAYKMASAGGDSLLVYPAKMGDKVVGFAVNTFSNNGFSGNIQLMVGFDTENKVVNYAILSHAETPGLGSKMDQWFKDPEKPNQSVIGYESEPITTQNLIVQYVSVSSYDTMYRNIALTGSGDCDYFINGRHISGIWSRPSLDEPTTYKLYDGSIIRLEPGNTWIEMMPNTRTIKVRYSE